MAKIVADQRARGGTKGRPVLLVLVGSMVLLAIYLGSMLLWSGSQTPTSPQQGASQQLNSGGSSSANSSRVPAENPAYPSPSAPSTGTSGSAPSSR